MNGEPAYQGPLDLIVNERPVRRWWVITPVGEMQEYKTEAKANAPGGAPTDGRAKANGGGSCGCCAAPGGAMRSLSLKKWCAVFVPVSPVADAATAAASCCRSCCACRFAVAVRRRLSAPNTD